jgi:hypothetical protein
MNNEKIQCIYATDVSSIERNAMIRYKEDVELFILNYPARAAS